MIEIFAIEKSARETCKISCLYKNDDFQIRNIREKREMGGSRGRSIGAFCHASRHVRRRLTKTRNNTCRLSRDNEPVSVHTGSIPFHSRHSLVVQTSLRIPFDGHRLLLFVVRRHRLHESHSNASVPASEYLNETCTKQRRHSSGMGKARRNLTPRDH